MSENDNRLTKMMDAIKNAAKDNGFILEINQTNDIDYQYFNAKIIEIGSYKNILSLIENNYKYELKGLYYFLSDYHYNQEPTDKLPNSIDLAFKALGLSHVSTCMDLYKFINNDDTRYQLSDDNIIAKLLHGITTDYIIKADKINSNDSDSINKASLVENLMKSASYHDYDGTNNHIITMIADIDDNSMPGWLIKQILLLDYINNNDINYSNNKSNRLISNDACEWLIANMNASMLSLKTEACNAGLAAILIKDAYDFIINNNVRPYQLPLTAISNILMTAYNIKDTNLYANALVAALFMTMAFIELNKMNDNKDYIDNMNFIFSDYKNLKAISEFISSELAPNLDKPIEFITELVKVNIQDMLK